MDHVSAQQALLGQSVVRALLTITAIQVADIAEANPIVLATGLADRMVCARAHPVLTARVAMSARKITTTTRVALFATVRQIAVHMVLVLQTVAIAVLLFLGQIVIRVLQITTLIQLADSARLRLHAILVVCVASTVRAYATQDLLAQLVRWT